MQKPASKKSNLLRIALHYISICDRSENEVRSKLAAKTNDQQAIDQTITKLRKNNFLNDRSLAFSIASHLLETKNKGVFYIRQKLQKRGFKPDLINQALSKIVTPDKQRRAIKKIISTRFKNKKQIVSLLASRGFAWQETASFVDEILQME